MPISMAIFDIQWSDFDTSITFRFHYFNTRLHPVLFSFLSSLSFLQSFLFSFIWFPWVSTSTHSFHNPFTTQILIFLCELATTNLLIGWLMLLLLLVTAFFFLNSVWLLVSFRFHFLLVVYFCSLPVFIYIFI